MPLEKNMAEVSIGPINYNDLVEHIESIPGLKLIVIRGLPGSGKSTLAGNIQVRMQSFPGHFEADDYLGCCSYGSFKEFTSAKKDYYVDMIRQSIDQINKEIESNNAATQRAWDIRRAKNLLAPYNLCVASVLQIDGNFTSIQKVA